MKIILNYLFISIIGLSFYSCGEDNKKQGETGDVSVYGETLNIALNQDIKELDPIKMVDGYSGQIVGQIFEGLVKFNTKDLSIEPLLAEKWTIDDEELVYTFKLKKNVFFHDNNCFENGKGRELKANDVVFSINRACNTPSANYAYNLLKNKLSGAKECYENETINEVSGVKAIDDYTISFTLTKPSSNFLQTLATSSLAIIPEEAAKSENLILVGTGPFVFDNNSIKENIITLKRNNNYHVSDEKGNKLPYLDAVAFHIIPKSQDRLEQFQNKKLDIIVDLPSASIKDVVENQIADFESKPPKYVLGRYPELVSTYLEFNTKVEPFKNIKIRRAIAMAIDKVKIVDVVLNGEAYGPALNGIVPPAINNYDYSSVIGIEYNIDKAKILLAEAGHKNGEGLPLIKFYIGGNENQLLKVALEIQKQLITALNINTEIVTLGFAEKLAMDQMAQGSMGISAWLADFPTADNFLNIGYGGYVPASLESPSFPNSSRFVNKEFDSYFEQAISTTEEKKRNELILKAEQILINEAPIVPLWYNENYRLFQSNIMNYQPNVMHLHQLSIVRKIAQNNQTKEKK